MNKTIVVTKRNFNRYACRFYSKAKVLAVMGYEIGPLSYRPPTQEEMQRAHPNMAPMVRVPSLDTVVAEWVNVAGVRVPLERVNLISQEMDRAIQDARDAMNGAMSYAV